MPSPRVLNFSLGFILALTLSLTATAAAQAPCPSSGGSVTGDCLNSRNLTYTEFSSTTVNGLYTNLIAVRVTATGDNGTALTVDDFANSGTVDATGSGYGISTGIGYGIRVNSGFTNSGTVYATASGSGYGTSGISIGYGYGIRVDSGDFANSGTVHATGSGTGGGTGYGGGYGIRVDSGDFANSGTVYATGSGTRGSGIGYGTGYGIWVDSGDFANNGTVYATGSGTGGGYGSGIWVNSGDFANSGTVYATGSGDGGGIGIWVNSGDFANSGTVYATASGTDTGIGGGIGILVNSGFTNNGTVYATGSGTGTSSGYGIDSSYGIWANGAFTNAATVYATGTGGGSGIRANGGFANSGTVYATGTGGGTGIQANGTFTNTGELILSSNGGTALYFSQFPANTFEAQSGSSLIMAGSGPAMVFESAYLGTLNIDPEAGLTMMNANELGNGSQTFVVAQNVTDTGSNKFILPDSAVFSYDQQWQPSGGSTGGNFEVEVTRRAWASDLTGGQGGEFVAGLEDYFLNNGTGSTFDTPAWNWLNLLHGINSGSTADEVKGRGQDAARLNSAQATGQSLNLVKDASRQISSKFAARQISSKFAARNQLIDKPEMYDNYINIQKYPAPSTGSGGSSTSVWLSPFYLTSTQDASDRSLSRVDSDWWGFSLGAAHSPQDNLNFGLGFHFLKGDFDAGREYEADSTAWGLDLGLAASLGRGRYRPLLTAAISHTRHDFDQIRRVDGYAYKSSPDISLTTAALGLSQVFHLDQTGAFILRPKIGLDWTRTKMDSYVEQGSGPRALRVDSENFDSFRSELGTALIWTPTESLELELRAAWLHEFGDRAPVLTSAARDLPGLGLYTPRSENNRDAANLGASASLDVGSGFSLGLDYDGLFNGDLDSHQIGASLKYVF